MAHFEKNAPRKRISVSNQILKPRETLELFVWGWVEGLSIRSTDDSVVKVTTPLSSNGRCSITAVAPQKLEVPRVELVMNGTSVWDYFEVSVVSGSLPPGFNQQQDYVHPGNRKVLVTAFWSKNATPNTFSHTAEVARLILARHGLVLHITPGVLPAAPHTLAFDEVVQFGGQIEALREQAEKTGLAADNKLVVIVVPCSEKLDGAGEDSKTPYGWNFPAGKFRRPFVVINSTKTSATAVTLLHEIGHAAGLGHEHGGAGAVVANFMNEPEYQQFKTPGTSMYRSQVVAVANAFFTSP